MIASEKKIRRLSSGTLKMSAKGLLSSAGISASLAFARPRPRLRAGRLGGGLIPAAVARTDANAMAALGARDDFNFAACFLDLFLRRRRKGMSLHRQRLCQDAIA